MSIAAMIAQINSYPSLHALVAQQSLPRSVALLNWLKSPTYAAMLAQQRRTAQFGATNLTKILAERDRQKRDFMVSVSQWRAQPRTAAACSRPHLGDELHRERQPDPNFGFRSRRWPQES